jgi:RNA ligase-like protein
MGYLHIENLYKSQDILLFRRCYALEKVHGTSAHVAWGPAGITFFSGGESHTRFVGLFDGAALQDRFKELGHAEVTVYGEAYGGSQQGMRLVYGLELCFIAFDVQVGPYWLSVKDADQVCQSLGIEFVPYEEISTELTEIDRARDQPSVVAVRRGTGDDKPREGVILRPLIEMTKNNGSRVIAKHKTDTFAERATPPKVVDAAKLEVLAAAEAIAQEWVTPMRLVHVLDKLGATEMSDVPKVIRAMVEDVFREAKGEIVESKDARTAIGKRTARLFKERLDQAMRSA